MKRFNAMRTRLFGAVMAFGLLAAAVASAQWTPGTNVPMTGNYWSFGAAEYNGSVYTLGGVTNNSQGLTNKVLKYDIENDTWTAVANLFQGVYFGVAAEIGGKIYMAGGQTSGANTSFVDGTIIFDPETGGVSAGSTLSYPLTASTGVSVDGKLVLMGGLKYLNAQQNTIVADIHVYTPGGSWLELTGKMPAPLYYAQSTAEGNTIYLAGGANGLGLQQKAYKGTISGTNITWTPIADLPVPIIGGGMAMIDGRPMIAGGTSDGSNPNLLSYIYDSENDVWEPFYQLPVGAFFGGLVSDGSRAILIGGQTSIATHVAELGEAAPVASFGQNLILASSNPGGTVIKRITVGNGGLAPLEVSATVPDEAKDWLTVGSVTVEPSKVSTIDFSFDATGLSDGVYTTTVALSHNDESQGAHEVSIQFYVGDLPELQDLNVVIEEASGDWCGWCPDGQKYLRQLEEKYPDNVITLSYHGGSDSEPLLFPGGQGFLSMTGTNSYPSAAIQRIRFPGEASLMTSRGAWTQYTEAVLNAFDHAPVTLTIDEYSFDPNTREVTATVSATTADWISDDVTRFGLTAVITQNGIYTRQVDYVENTEHPSYEQKHAVRHVWPAAAGNTFTMSTTENVEGYYTPGRTGTMEVKFTVPESSGVADFEIIPEDSHITFFLNTGTNAALGMILQGQRRELVSDVVAGPSISVNWGASQTREINSEETATFNIEVTNNTSEPTTVTLTRAKNTMPNGWMSELCTGPGECNDADVVSTTIPADSKHTFNLEVYGGNSNETGKVTLVVASNDVSQQQEFTVNTKVSSVKVAGEKNGLSLASVTPNPASTVARVEVTLPTAAQTTLEVYTTGGEKVATLFEGRLEEGTRQINADVTGLASGKYVLVLTSGETKVSRTLTVVR